MKMKKFILASTVVILGTLGLFSACNGDSNNAVPLDAGNLDAGVADEM